MGQATRTLASRLAKIPTPGAVSVWSTGGNLGTARYALAGAGTQAAGLAFGSFTATEEYNGSNWSASNNLNNGRYALAGAGTQAAGLAFGGNLGGSS
jgi:hypothetical protein